ncbi:MAG: hypothetical protein L6V93_12830 [Clostridiales bacterium]|nr:MAG: hypothetical protein L6V93_12830 [Clostridiales bacterium]
MPNNKTSTGDNSGTVGKDDEDKKNTFVVKATDKMNVVIPNCEVYIGESNNIVVDLPDGIKPTSDASRYHHNNRPTRRAKARHYRNYIRRCGLHRKRRNRYVRKNHIADSKGRIYRRHRQGTH